MAFNISHPEFNFGNLSVVNWNRCVSDQGFSMDPDSEKWKETWNLYMVNTISQEAGELGAVITKLKRGFNQREYKKMIKRMPKHAQVSMSENLETPTYEECEKLWLRTMQKKLKDEASDLFGYFDLFLTNNNIPIRHVFADKFNEVSRDMECPQFKL